MESPAPQIQEIRYQPQGSYPYDLEVFRISELRQRTSWQGMRRTYGYTFYMLILVTEGRCLQLLDFEPYSCMEGSLVVVRPGQTHSFGEDEDWEGWILLVRPEFLWSASSQDNFRSRFYIERLPDCLHIDARGLQRATTTIIWMMEDTAIHDQISRDNPLLNAGRPGNFIEDMLTNLRYGFYSLVSWLVVTYCPDNHEEAHKRPTLERFHRFKNLVEQHFAEWKDITTYAAEMGCTERSLTRAVLDAEGTGAKEFVLKRLNLEARRLLIQTDWPVGIIADKLQFREATHFSKFFRRMNRCTPKKFRSMNGQL